MGLHFIFNGVHQGEPGLLATLQEHPTQLERIVSGFGWSLDEEGVELMYRSPVDLYIDQWVYDLLEAVERSGARRVLIDSLTDLQHAAPDEARFREYMYSLLQRLSRQGVSLFMTSELADLFDVSRLSEFGLTPLRQRRPAPVRPRGSGSSARPHRAEDPREPSRAASPRVQNHVRRDSPWPRVRLGAHSRAEPPVAGRAARARRRPAPAGRAPRATAGRPARQRRRHARSPACQPAAPRLRLTGAARLRGPPRRPGARVLIQEVADTGTPQHVPEFRHESPSTRQAGGAPPCTASTGPLGARRGHARRRPHRSGSRATPTRRARRAPADVAPDDRGGSRRQPGLLASAGHRRLVPALPSTWRRSDCSTNTPSATSSPPAAFAQVRFGASRSSRSPQKDPTTMMAVGRLSLLGSLGLHSVEVRWLTARDVAIGTLTIGARTKRRLSDGDVVLLDAAAARLGNALAAVERSPQFLHNRSLQMARLSAAEEEAWTGEGFATTRGGDPPPLRRGTGNRSDRRAARALAAHSANTRQERSSPTRRYLAARALEVLGRTTGSRRIAPRLGEGGDAAWLS